MGEIKSTLDLVMEKTKNLNLSNEEKQEHQTKEIAGRLRGLLQKFKDQLITMEQFNSEYRILSKEYNLAGAQNKHLIKEVCGQIKLGQDNQMLFDLLSQYTDSSLEGIISVIKNFNKELEAAAGQQTKTLKGELAKTHFISGSAIVPNLERAPAWRQKAGEIEAQYIRLLEAEKTNVLEGK